MYHTNVTSVTGARRHGRRPPCYGMTGSTGARKEIAVTQPPMTATRPLHVVPHTHWDCEWYRPFEAYRFRLVETLDGLLAADLPYFLLDGQTVVLDDYLA